MLMPKNMTMVGPGFWDGIDNGDGIPNIWDFPMESLEADDLCEDWDYKFQCLGPVLSEAFSALPQVPLADVGNGALDMLPNSSVPSVGDSHLIQQPDFVEEISIRDFLIDSFDDKESGAFQPPSPISVLESNSSSCSPENSISIGPQLSIPVRTRSKRPQPRPSTSNPWLLMSPIPSTSKKNAYPRKSKEKKKMKLSKLSDVMEMKEKSLQHPVGTKKCTHCEITRTPQWREGPMGPKTLCNACGVRYRSGRLFPEYRPAASPTFVPSLHSNSHKRVIEMRNKCIEETSTCEEDRALSPPPEFVPMSSYLFDLV